MKIVRFAEKQIDKINLRRSLRIGNDRQRDGKCKRKFKRIIRIEPRGSRK